MPKETKLRNRATFSVVKLNDTGPARDMKLFDKEHLQPWLNCKVYKGNTDDGYAICIIYVWDTYEVVDVLDIDLRKSKLDFFMYVQGALVYDKIKPFKNLAKFLSRRAKHEILPMYEIK